MSQSHTAYLLAGIVAHHHDAICETLEVDQLLCFFKLLGVILTLNFEVAADLLCCTTPKARDVNDRDYL